MLIILLIYHHWHSSREQFTEFRFYSSKQTETTQTKFAKRFLQNLIAELFTLDELSNDQTTERDKTNCSERTEGNAYVLASYSNNTKIAQ